MPIKKTPNQLNFSFYKDAAVISIFTLSKKAHFSCSESKLFEILEDSIHDNYKYFQVHLTTFPFIAVHITGTPDKIEENEVRLRTAIEESLARYHERGNVKL
jgi:hypothetical protein